MEPVERERIRSLLGRKLAKYAAHIERATIRIDDVNGPRGGVDTLCKIKIVISGSPSTVVEERGVVVEDVVVVAARVAARAVRRFSHGLPDEATLPAEILDAAGYRTGGLWRNGWVWSRARSRRSSGDRRGGCR